MTTASDDLAVRSLSLVSRLLVRCPRWLLWRLAALVSRIAVLVNARAAATTRINLARCYPSLEPTARSRLVHDSLTHTAMIGLESGMVFHAAQPDLDAAIGRIDGLSELETALQSSRGVLLLVPHFGNWEFLALYLGRYQLVALYDPPDSPGMDDLIRRSRQRTGARLLPLDRAGLRAAMTTLAGGGLLGILPDQVPDRRAGLHVPFFSQPALTMTLVPRLINRCTPAVMLGSAKRTRSGFDLCFRTVSADLMDPDPESALSAMNQEIESLISQAPAQYQWEYRRFKSPPEGQPKIY